MKKYLWMVVFSGLFFVLASFGGAFASQQDDVNYIITKIRTNLNESMDSPKWKDKYSMVSKNIDDLKNTLSYGGAVTSNPVKEFYDKLDCMLKERRQEWKIYCDTQEKISKLRKIEAKEAINDIGVEMINRLTSIRPGVLTPVSAARTKNAKIIKEDFARLKNFDEAIKQIEDYKKSILPSIRDIRDRKHALEPILEKYNKLSGPLLSTGFDGKYKCRVGLEMSPTKFTVIVSGGAISGTFEGDYLGGSYSDTTIKGTMTGGVDASGSFKGAMKIYLMRKGADALVYEGSFSGKITKSKFLSGSFKTTNKRLQNDFNGSFSGMYSK